MSQTKEAPYGSWQSPITSDMIVGATVGLGQIALDGEDTYWIELRPSEGGRNCIVRRTPDGLCYLDVRFDDVGVHVEINGAHHYAGLTPVADARRRNHRAMVRMASDWPAISARMFCAPSTFSTLKRPRSGSATSAPSTLTTCRSTSIRTGPAASTPGSGSASAGSLPRRSTARTRAISSRAEYGLVT